jgi:hypothetical protein
MSSLDDVLQSALSLNESLRAAAEPSRFPLVLAARTTVEVDTSKGTSPGKRACSQDNNDDDSPALLSIREVPIDPEHGDGATIALLKNQNVLRRGLQELHELIAVLKPTSMGLRPSKLLTRSISWSVLLVNQQQRLLQLYGSLSPP